MIALALVAEPARLSTRSSDPCFRRTRSIERQPTVSQCADGREPDMGRAAGVTRRFVSGRS